MCCKHKLVLRFSFLVSLYYLQVCSSPIVGGFIVSTNNVNQKYSYLVSLQSLRTSSNNSSNKYYHFCVGSFISPEWILTAAHCVYYKNLRNVFVAIGTRSIMDENVVRHEISQIQFNKYIPSSLKNDIALLKLKPNNMNIPARFGVLPHLGLRANRNRACKILGYGALKHGGYTQDRLHEAEVKVIPTWKCVLILGSVMAPGKGDNTVCALGDGQDSCQGDSGGPLICPKNGKDYIFGIVSHGLTCGGTGIPSVYTVTIPYLNWIHELTNTTIKK